MKRFHFLVKSADGNIVSRVGAGLILPHISSKHDAEGYLIICRPRIYMSGCCQFKVCIWSYLLKVIGDALRASRNFAPIVRASKGDAASGILSYAKVRCGNFILPAYIAKDAAPPFALNVDHACIRIMLLVCKNTNRIR
ncbi:hypothetical protein D3C78_1098990 [compost metagenome]